MPDPNQLPDPNPLTVPGRPPEPGPHDLLLTRNLAAPRSQLWRAWTEPDLLMQWFCPKPWTTTACSIDLRPGGVFATTMQGPDGKSFPNEGLYLEIVPLERLVFTDTLTAGWRPADPGFFTAIVTFRERPDGGTQYSALALHRNAADRGKHEAMGFHTGWGAAADQLDALALGLA